MLQKENFHPKKKNVTFQEKHIFFWWLEYHTWQDAMNNEIVLCFFFLSLLFFLDLLSHRPNPMPSWLFPLKQPQNPPPKEEVQATLYQGQTKMENEKNES